MTARLVEDPHLWAVTLFDELQPLGFDRSYPTLTRQIRTRGCARRARPVHRRKTGRLAIIEHPPGEETQWDWLELPDPPAAWGWGKTAHLLVGALSIPAAGAASSPKMRRSRIWSPGWTLCVASSVG